MYIKSILILTIILFSSFGAYPKESQYDLIVYGGSSSGVIAAYAAAKDGLKVALVEPKKHLGGLTSGGLGHVDIGKPQTVGGYAKEFLLQVGKHYGLNRMCYDMEASVAEKIFMEMLAQVKVDIFYNSALQPDQKGVIKKGGRITGLILEDGNTLHGRYYIDATYVGDLMAASGVSYTVGRESKDKYGESSAGIQEYKLVRRLSQEQIREIKELKTAFPLDYVFDNKEKVGDADNRVQTYTYRLCITTDSNNQKAFSKPHNYDPRRYSHILARIVRLQQFSLNKAFTLYPLPNNKFDVNHMELINASRQYPDGTYSQREFIEQSHKEYQQGLLYCLTNDQNVPEALRKDMRRYGYALDEFVDNDNWPYHLYIREARRMVGQYVMKQQDAWKNHTKDDVIALGSYFMDCHTVERFITPTGEQFEEGEMEHAPFRPYAIPYGAIVPRISECENLLVTVCFSASHTIYGSLRMEPVFMMAGHAAATAASIAATKDSPVQNIDIKQLQEKLLAQGQILNYKTEKGFYIPKEEVEGYVMDDTDASTTGYWEHSTATAPFLMYGYRFAPQSEKSERRVEYTPDIKEGRYEIEIMYAPDNNRSQAVEVVIKHADGEKTVYVDMTDRTILSNNWLSLGEYDLLGKGLSKVTITGKGKGGIVITDAVRFIKK